VAGSTIRRVRNANADDASACAGIVAGLPDFFTADVADKVCRDLAAQDSWVIAEAASVAGYAVVERRGSAAAEILWAAVSAMRRNHGIGTALIEHVLDELRDGGTQVVEVKTLDPTAGYPPYAATYAFWRARGFVHVDTIDPLPGWEPGNPCAVLIAALASSR
jgi:GNAT superfamily N-acetyltransferase